MIIHYRRGYDPEEVLNIVSVRPARTLKDASSWFKLQDDEGTDYDATLLSEEDGVWVAYLPENW